MKENCNNCKFSKERIDMVLPDCSATVMDCTKGRVITFIGQEKGCKDFKPKLRVRIRRFIGGKK